MCSPKIVSSAWMGFGGYPNYPLDTEKLLPLDIYGTDQADTLVINPVAVPELAELVVYADPSRSRVLCVVTSTTSAPVAIPVLPREISQIRVVASEALGVLVQLERRHTGGCRG